MAVAVLLIQDDPRIASFVRRGLEAEGYAADLAGDLRDALARVRATTFPLIVLDRALRRAHQHVPLLAG